ncbi:DUF58 domain-containing protein [Pseudonocardia acaciae]|uniref:DUF58 domain-containing protein n=1 Tax=Pseudonocardia acaciae TaxID=551276 RepID=UPI00048D3749|nr:DUF58 domain-containing protein [Pseudonocardia acaciae]
MPDPAGTTSAGLTTLGRCLIAAGVAASVCAVALDERDLLRIGLLVLVLPLLAALLAARTRLVIKAEREVLPARVSAGSEVEARLIVHRPSRLIDTGMMLTDALPDALGGSPRFISRPSKKSDPAMDLRYPIPATVRGVHLIGPLTVRVGDPLGLAEYERELAGRSTLTVLPRVTPLSGLPDGFGRGEGDAGNTGLRRGLGEHDAMVREYQPGDALRMVHWRSTARRDELMVRLEERPWHGGVTVLLDRRAHAHRGVGAQASLEWAIELAASVCQHLIYAGRRVNLVAENGVMLSTGRDPEELLDTLATLRPSTQQGLIPPPPNGGELFAILGAVDTDAVQPLLRGANGGHGHAVLMDVSAWIAPNETPPPTGIAAPARVLADAGWTALVGRPERDPDRVWNEFCKRLPVRLGLGR